MWWLLLILLAALVVVFWKRRDLGETANPLMGALVALALIASIYSMVRERRPGSPNLQLEFHRAAATKLGEAIAADFPQGGTVLVVHGGRLNDMLRQVTEAQLDGLRKGFGNVPLKIVEAGPASVENPDAIFMMENMVPLERIRAWSQNAGGVQAVVLLLGPPQVASARPAGLPAIYALTSLDRMMAEELLRTGIVRAAVIYKENVDWKAEPRRGMSVDEIFNIRYELRRAAR